MRAGPKKEKRFLEFRRGRSDCWEEILGRTIGPLYGMFINRGMHPALAEELTQKTVFDAVRARNSYEPGKGSPEQWILAIGKNNLYLEIRQRLSRTRLNGELLKYLQAVEAEPLPDEVLERQETAELVRRALGELEEKEQTALRAKYLENLSARQIGEKLQITEKAVHSLLYRARNVLRGKLIELAPLFQEAQDYEKKQTTI